MRFARSFGTCSSFRRWMPARGGPSSRFLPAELAAHPTDDAGHHELYLMCDDIEAAIRELERKDVDISRPISEERWGRLAAIRMPDGSELRLYQPNHPTPPHRAERP